MSKYQVVRVLNQSPFTEEGLTILVEKLNDSWKIVNIHNDMERVVSFYLISKD